MLKTTHAQFLQKYSLNCRDHDENKKKPQLNWINGYGDMNFFMWRKIEK